MLHLVLLLVALGVVAGVAGYIRNRELKKQLERGEINEMPTIRKRPEGCCGKHAVCEKDQLLAAAGKDVEYFDDEELDVFKERPSDQYTPEEVERFEEVMTTMRPDEVQDRLHSLNLRGINLPDELKDEAIMLMEG